MNIQISMRRLWAATLWSFLLVGSVSAQTVVSWNLEWFPGRKPEHPNPSVVTQQMATARAVLARLQPDVFVGLELRDHEVFDSLVSVVTGMQVAVVSAFRDEDGRIARQQIGIASRYPIYTAWSESWLPTMDRLPRGFAVAAVREPKSGKLLIVYGVHLKSNRAQHEKESQLNVAMRNESAHQLVGEYEELHRLVVREDETLGWVIAGDFNTNQDGQFAGDEVIHILEQAGFHNSWADTPAAQRKTWRGEGNFPPTTFDYIMTRGLGTPTAKLGEAPEESSDHLPVILDLGAASP